MPLDVSRFRRLAKEGAWILAGQIASVAGALALVRVLTEYLEPAQYGQLALGLTVATLVNQIVMGGMTAGIGRFYSIADESNDLPGYLRASKRLMGYAGLVVAGLMVLLIVGLPITGHKEWVGLGVAALLLSLLSGFNASLVSIQNAARQRGVVAFHTGLDAWLKILLAVGVMIWLGKSSTAVVLGYTLSSLIVTVSQFVFLRRLIGPTKTECNNIPDWMRKIWSYSWPFSIFGFFTWMQQISDRWALQLFSSENEVGLYAVVFQLGFVPVGLLTGMVMAFLGPILYQRSGSASDHGRNLSVHRLAWQVTLIGLVVTALVALFTAWLHEWIFHVLVASKYHAVSYLLPWMVLAGGIFAAGQMLALKLMSEMKSASMTIAKVVTAILGVLLNIYGASIIGMQGVVGALVIFATIYFLWMAWLAQHPASENQHFRHHENRHQS